MCRPMWPKNQIQIIKMSRKAEHSVVPGNCGNWRADFASSHSLPALSQSADHLNCRLALISNSSEYNTAQRVQVNTHTDPGKGKVEYSFIWWRILLSGFLIFTRTYVPLSSSFFKQCCLFLVSFILFLHLEYEESAIKKIPLKNCKIEFLLKAGALVLSWIGYV